MPRVINDHIWMLPAKGGPRKAVPCWQIRQWLVAAVYDLALDTGNRVGYDFQDPESGRKDYAAWIAEEARKVEAEKRRFKFPVPANAGIADIDKRLAQHEAETEIWGTPPPDAGSEAVGKPERPKHRDVI
jgi:hypothetical protein